MAHLTNWWCLIIEESGSSVLSAEAVAVHNFSESLRTLSRWRKEGSLLKNLFNSISRERHGCSGLALGRSWVGNSGI